MDENEITMPEAIESGRPFKRPLHDLWLYVFDEQQIKTLCLNKSQERRYNLTITDLAARDWIIKSEEKPREWTIFYYKGTQHINGPTTHHTHIRVIEKLPGYRMLSRKQIDDAIFGRIPYHLVKFCLKELGFDET